MELADFVIDPGASILTATVSVDGKVAAEAAALLDDTFGTDAREGGLVIGVATLTLDLEA